MHGRMPQLCAFFSVATGDKQLGSFAAGKEKYTAFATEKNAE
jgi:hypothetical protein